MILVQNLNTSQTSFNWFVKLLHFGIEFLFWGRLGRDLGYSIDSKGSSSCLSSSAEVGSSNQNLGIGEERRFHFWILWRDYFTRRSWSTRKTLWQIQMLIFIWSQFGILLWCNQNCKYKLKYRGILYSLHYIGIV